MPYKSQKQRAYMEGCYHNPGSMSGRCPSKKAIRKIRGDND
jgi:hypothetical protein